MVEGIPLLNNEHSSSEGYALGKQHREEFPSHLDKRKRDILELVHTYAYGPMQTISIGGEY